MTHGTVGMILGTALGIMAGIVPIIHGVGTRLGTIAGMEVGMAVGCTLDGIITLAGTTIMVGDMVITIIGIDQDTTAGTAINHVLA